MNEIEKLWDNEKGVICNMIAIRDAYIKRYQQSSDYNLALVIGSISALVERKDYQLMISKIENERREFHGEERTR